MALILQWIVVGLIGSAALLFAARHFGLLGRAKGAGGGCSKCGAVAKMAAALQQLEQKQPQ